MKKIAVSGIVHYRDKLLFCRRFSFSAYPNLWEFPTEPLEGDETLEEAVERLFFERLSLFPSSIVVRGGADLGLEGGMRLYWADVKVKSHYVGLYGYSRFKWMDPKSVKTDLLAPASAFLVKKINM